MPQPKEEEDENIDSQNDADDGDDNAHDNGNDGGSADDSQHNDSSADEGRLTEDEIDEISDVDELREKLKGNTKANRRLFERTMKAEGKVLDKATGKWVKKSKPAPTNDGQGNNNQNQNRQNQNQNQAKQDIYVLTPNDTLTLFNANVGHPEDVQVVQDYAQLKKITIAEALTIPFVKSQIKEQQEHRRTADASNTGATRRSNAPVAGDKLLERASKTGEIPEDDADVQKMADERMEKIARKNRRE